MLRSRLISAAIALPLFCAALFLASSVVWGILLALAVTAGAREWARLCGYSPAFQWSYALSTGLVLGLVTICTGGRTDFPIIDITLVAATAFWGALVPFWLNTRWKAPGTLALVLGVMILLSTWAAMLRFQVDPPVLLSLLGISWVSDSGAYFAGRKWGKHKLAPQISPGKTWEGVCGGLTAVGIYYVTVYIVFFEGRLASGIISGLLVFLAAAVLGIIGDLFESLLKRQAGIKDSGAIMPGHGGMLDRIDSLTASMPFLAVVAEAGLLK